MATPNVKQIVLKPNNLGVYANKPHGPIGAVAPMAHKEEEPKPIVQEEKKLAPSSGPSPFDREVEARKDRSRQG